MGINDRDYDNGEIVVHWRPELCTHCEECFRGLPSVFDPNRRPWVKLSMETSERIIEQVQKCPSGALSYSESGKVVSDGR
jgi:uncharacterized Fe-S cluster protein YjdI